MDIRTFFVAGGLTASLALTGCSDDWGGSRSAGVAFAGDGTQLIEGELDEWKVEVKAKRAKAGTITFTIQNEGSIGHEFLVIRTDLPLGAIPLEGDRFSEENPDLSMIDEIGEYAVGTIESLTVTLEPGTYQLVCNLAGHYGAGMFTDFTVEA